ncbi:hypothetical protein GXM_02747 [Nostoc sphaeroides CCNUC1]|uniref:Uncharacterized protein n=1 Tax=Nostoc sphaeroides CCNUC1 TaxID=2653204 RepID=A0A5P8VY10_9NOSO|nr:hypothetical protein GXM_02747 [Nostoc sphaeroides CCNUC1]
MPCLANPQLNIDSCFTLFLNRQSLFSIPHWPLATSPRREYYVNNSSCVGWVSFLNPTFRRQCLCNFSQSQAY